MARPLRIAFPGAFYHVTARGNERKAVFKSIRDRQKFLEYLETATERYNAVIHAYCLMDNHYHLLLETPSGNLPQIMQHINGAYTTYFNVKRARAGHLFQGRYNPILVEMDEYAKELSKYIHLNPVRAKLAKTPDKYEWSSYNLYIGVERAPNWLHRDFILGYFGDKVSVAQLGYKEFVSLLVAQKYDSPLKEVTASVLLGRQDFIEFIKGKYLSDKKPVRDVPAIGQLAPRITCQEICDRVESEFGKDPVTVRSIKLYLCRKHSGEKLRTIGAQFGIGDAAVAQSCKRFDVKLEKDRKLRRKIERFEKSVFLSNVETYHLCFLGGSRDLAGALKGSDVLLTSYGILRRDIEQLSRIPFSLAVFDEFHHIKNTQTQAYQAALAVRAISKIGLTGTPIENSINCQ